MWDVLITVLQKITSVIKREQYGMVDGVKGGRKIEKCEQGYFSNVGCKEEVVESVNEGCFGALMR